MRRRPGWIRIGIALGVVGALLVASPALGGPSLQSLVKKEVAKQFAATEAAKKKKKKSKPPATTVVQRTATLGPINSGAAGEATASCVGSEKATGGGFAAQSGFGRLDGSRPVLNAAGVPTGWRVSIGNNSPGSATFEVYVMCISP